MISEYVLGGALIFMSVILVLLVLMQTGKDKSLSGTISGGSADTYYGKGKAQRRDKLLARLTIIAAVIFAILILVTFVWFSYNEQWILQGVKDRAAEAAANAAAG
ncbi:MAG: preprotein translocase subunit SecG [Clostridia bacterium]|nr:preprotein translocase subunit SecG [Clostridia bacterium]